MTPNIVLNNVRLTFQSDKFERKIWSEIDLKMTFVHFKVMTKSYFNNWIIAFSILSKRKLFTFPFLNSAIFSRHKFPILPS
jgi:hypothetical protein